MVMPHTSWHDFYVAIICKGALGVQINWVGKKELFRFPFGFFFKFFGGLPLDREGNKNKVESIVDLFNSRETFRLGISPEGTRKKVDNLKTGFYYISLQANIPIIPVSINFEKKVVHLGTPFNPTGDITQDFDVLLEHFIDSKGKIPANDYKIRKS